VGSAENAGAISCHGHKLATGMKSSSSGRFNPAIKKGANKRPF